MALRTPLHDAHVAAGARMVEFAGFDMPVRYTGTLDEHGAVRQRVGIFDVSHMGEVTFEGPRALEALNRLVTNDLSACEDGQAQYNCICLPDGGIIDDTVIYRRSAEDLLVCVNASNRDKDFSWLSEHGAGEGVRVTDRGDEYAQIALQGPRADAVLSTMTNLRLDQLGQFRFADTQVLDRSALVARTGYTGERGFELFLPASDAMRLWEALLHAGEVHGLRPCGLGARDTLRLEMKYCLYGNDIDEGTTPLQAGLGWAVKLKKGEFIGREALLAEKEAGIPRRLVGFEVTGRGIARHGYPILKAGEVVGEVTSGTQSPSLARAIGMGYVPTPLRKSGTELEIDVRGRAVPARVVKTPFYRPAA
jgi:aminomethyltransferase